MTELNRDGWIVAYCGSIHSGYDSGRVWYSDYDTACQDVEARKAIYGIGNVHMSPRYVIG